MSITLIIFGVAVFITYLCNVLFVSAGIGFGMMTLCVLGAVILEMLLNAFIATLVCKWLPQKWFDSGKKIFKVPKWETNLFVALGVKKWKDNVLELGQLNGFKKDKLASTTDSNYINMFLRECNKGYIDHLVSIILSPLILLVFIPKPILILTIGLPVMVISIVINFMSLAILRYNVPRLEKMLALNKRREEVAKKNAEKAEENEKKQATM